MKRLFFTLLFAGNAVAQPMAEPIMIMDQVVPQIDCVPYVRAQAASEGLTRAEMRSALLRCQNQNIEAEIAAERAAVERLQRELEGLNVNYYDSEWLIGLPQDPYARIEFLEGQLVVIELQIEELTAEHQAILAEVDAILDSWVNGT